MLAVGLTGGIGSGKSHVSDQLRDKGAIVIDADEIAREVVAPSGTAYQPLIDCFGKDILDSNGYVDRPLLAAKVFNDPDALADLNAITHPAIGIEMIRRRDAMADLDVIVVLAIPLLTTLHRQTVGLKAVVVVDCPLDITLDRLITIRKMDPNDANARIRAQISREQRCAGADFVVDNSSTLEHLDSEIERLWRWLEGLKVSLADIQS